MKILLIFFFISFYLIRGENRNKFIVDYYDFKKIKSFVGFSCNSIEDDISLVSMLNKIGVSATLHKLSRTDQINKFSNPDNRKIGIYLDCLCYNVNSTTSLFLEASKFRIYDELHNWLVIVSNIDHVLRIIVDDAFGLSTDFVIAVPYVDANRNKYYNLYDVYNICKERGSNLNITFLGLWSKNKGLKANFNGTKFSRRANLHGITVKTSFLKPKYKPLNVSLENYLQDYTASTKDGLSKFGFIVVNHLSEMFNFKLQYKMASVWKAGDTIGPIIQALVDKEIDISGSPATMSVKRTYMVKYVHQSWPFRTCFLFRSPQRRKIKINEILGPFDTQVWYLMFLIFLLSIFIVSSVLRYEDPKNIAMCISNSILITVGAICQQGTNIRMNLISLRMAFLCILLSSLIIYNYYSASVVSVRLKEPIFKMNDSLNELTKSALKFASEYMIYLELFFKSQDWEIQRFYNERWKKIPEDEKFMEPEKAIKLVQEGGFAYHSHPEVSYPLIERLYDNREICELTEVHLARPTWSTFAVSFNSTFTEMIKIGLMKISEVGVRKRQLQRWRSRKPHCETSILSASSVTIYEFAPHLIILVFGMVLALVTYVIERLNNGVLLEKID